MNKTWAGTMAVCAVALVAGCEWEGTDQSESVSQRYNWVSFDGVYRAATNAYLVSGFGDATPVTQERISTSVSGVSSYSGTLDNLGVTPGTLQIVAGVFVLTDNGNGVLSGGGKSGTIVYETGAWSINLAGEWPPAGTPITATYQHEESQESGSSGSPIYSFTVTQNGNSLTLLDNNGATYSGTISSIASTGGISQNEPSTTSRLPSTGDTVTGSFQVEGRSASGVNVTITGTLVGTVTATAATATTAASIQLRNRSIHGTWVEAGGETGDIYGIAQ